MEVKKGYKHTELGAIPEDWSITRLGDVASIAAGGTPSRAITSYWSGHIPWVTTKEVGKEKLAERLRR